VQRRSGKAQPAEASLPAPLFFPDAYPWLVDDSDPERTLEDGKAMARAFAAVLQESPRLNLARSFCASLLRTCWFEAQRKYRQAWALPDALFQIPPDGLDEPAASLACTMGRAAAWLDPITAGYLAGVTYTAMLPDQTRSRLGVYYTPPGLARRLLDMATAAGADWRSCRVVDPACGGGAFLAPIARRILSESRGLGARQIVRSIGSRVRGLEIDPFAAWASQVILELTLMGACREAGERLPIVVAVCNSLLTEVDEGGFDVVIGNPPYGRVTLSPEVRERYRRGLYGHANLYGLFTDLAIRLTRPGGVIAYVTPTSFLAGEYFKALRRLLAGQAPPSNIDLVTPREGVFDDVLQETLLATYQRGQKPASSSVYFIAPVDYDNIEVESAGQFALPSQAGNPWLIPRTLEQEQLIGALKRMPHRLRDYGYEVSTGPLVWNRHKKQLRSRADKATLPLIWAECVTPTGAFVFRADKKNHEPYFKPLDGDEWLITRKSCVLLQRTTAKEQNRRLIAAELPSRFLAEHGAVVIENHLNMIRPINGAPRIPQKVLTAFLNSEIVDKVFRCFSGSVAVSAYELEALPLPPPESFDCISQLVKTGADRAAIDEACAHLFTKRESA